MYCQDCQCLNPDYDPSTDTSVDTTPEPGKFLIFQSLDQIKHFQLHFRSMLVRIFQLHVGWQHLQWLFEHRRLWLGWRRLLWWQCFYHVLQRLPMLGPRSSLNKIHKLDPGLIAPWWPGYFFKIKLLFRLDIWQILDFYAFTNVMHVWNLSWNTLSKYNQNLWQNKFSH